MSQPAEISVIIATHGRPARLRRCLAGLARMRYPRDRFEVIVVDDGSPMPVIDCLRDDPPSRLSVTHIRQNNLGPGVARNRGVEVACGRWIVFIDDDCIPHRDWLRAMERELLEHPDQMVGGRIVNGYPKRLFDTASWVLLMYLYEYMERTPDAPRFFAAMNVGMSRELFLEIGGFDEVHSFLAEDRDLCDRWALSGHGFHYAKSAAIRHQHGLTLSKFWCQHNKYGRGARRYHLARAARQQGPVRVEPWGFYLGLMMCPLKLRAPLPRRLALVACMVMSQVAMVAGHQVDKWRGGHGDSSESLGPQNFDSP